MMTMVFPLDGKLFGTRAVPPQPGVTATNHNIWLIEPAPPHFQGGRLKRHWKDD